MLISFVVWLCLLGGPSPVRQARPVQPEHLVGLTPQAVEWVLGEKPGPFVRCGPVGVGGWSDVYMNAASAWSTTSTAS